MMLTLDYLIWYLSMVHHYVRVCPEDQNCYQSSLASLLLASVVIRMMNMLLSNAWSISGKW